MMQLVKSKTPKLDPPPDRGRLLTAKEVADMIGGISPSWVRRYVPHKLPLGPSTKRWFELDIREWLESNRPT